MLRRVIFCLGLMGFLFGGVGTVQAAPDVVVYPAPAGEKLSEDFQVTVAGQAVPVYVARVSAVPLNQVWPGYQRPIDQTELASFASWDMPAATGVEVEVLSSRPVESVAIRPSSRAIQPQVEGRRIRFRLERPGQITVEVNGWHQALHLFADPPATDLPDPKAPGVHYFGPGVHQADVIQLKDNETLYLAGGAVVYGTVDVQGASHVRIVGRGILDSSRLERSEMGQWAGCIRLRDCHQVEIEGVILRDPPAWCLSTFGCSDLAITNVKLIGLWRYNADGIDLCDSHTAAVRNCFVRSFDDSLVIKGLNQTDTTPIHDILFEGCVVWNDWGRALEFGAETSSPEMRNIVFRDCDVIRTVHVALDVQHSDRAAITEAVFENIRVEIDDVNWKPQFQTSREDKYVERTDFCPRLLVLEIVKSNNSRDAERGTIDGVLVRNCTVTSKQRPPSLMRGFDEKHRVENVRIDNLRINGQAVKSVSEMNVEMRPFVGKVEVRAE